MRRRLPLALILLCALTTNAQAQMAPTPPLRAALVATTLSAANTAVTLTLSAPGAGLFHYVSRVEIVRVCPSAITGNAKLEITTTNLNALAWSVGNACAVGTHNTWVDLILDTTPLKSTTAATATTIVCPAAGAGAFCRVTAYYLMRP